MAGCSFLYVRFLYAGTYCMIDDWEKVLFEKLNMKKLLILKPSVQLQLKQYHVAMIPDNIVTQGYPIVCLLENQNLSYGEIAMLCNSALIFQWKP